MNPSTSRALNNEDPSLIEVPEKSLKRKARNPIPVGENSITENYIEGTILKKATTFLVTVPVMNIIQITKIMMVQMLMTLTDNRKKNFKRQLENAIHIGTGNNDTFIQTNYTIQNDERNLVVTDENHPNNEELQEIPNTQAVRQKKKHFSAKLKVTKKRQRNPNEGLKVKRMINRERSEAYVNCKGEFKPAKTLFTGALCPEKCRLKCSEAFTLEEREQLFTSYYKLDINSMLQMLCIKVCHLGSELVQSIIKLRLISTLLPLGENKPLFVKELSSNCIT
uniref:Uncharacterized protein n=2 Tax=Clastoptera arizonana TaxID=38151 RepID=A0A1B6DSG3_9HEMI